LDLLAQGKGAAVQKLLDYLRVPHLSTGEMLRAAVKAGTPRRHAGEEFMDHGRLVPDPLVLGMVTRAAGSP